MKSEPPARCPTGPQLPMRSLRSIWLGAPPLVDGWSHIAGCRRPSWKTVSEWPTKLLSFSGANEQRDHLYARATAPITSVESVLTYEWLLARLVRRRALLLAAIHPSHSFNEEDASLFDCDGSTFTLNPRCPKGIRYDFAACIIQMGPKTCCYQSKTGMTMMMDLVHIY
ncbi:hypothetical protein TTRE_0000485801 [Trichuris trichiura]|uniref:Uncharacterized protein n=1 Tax=Trichuris trichiura TaxID=36087 RepID=A0A077ZA93_TRITR|nr:hypothetical protein TTRE_0000485801 [Trichuris trichiura]